METKHTPGPWKFEKEFEDALSRGRYAISQQEGAPYTPNYSDVATTIAGERPEVAEANARLIAAAPDLYEALQELTELVEKMMTGEYQLDSFTLQPARIALSKATGAE